MIGQLPVYVYLVFVLTTLAAAWLFCRASIQPGVTAAALVVWLVLQGSIALSGFYLKINNKEFPYQLPVLMAPVIITIILLFATASGRRWLDGFNLKKLTWLHVVRIPVEITIYWWWIYKLVPKMMTFEGANLDILSGISALFVAWLINRNGINNRLLLCWNILCLLLVLNILIRAVLSLPAPFQKFGLDQPNIAVLHFPFVWLPACIVPLVVLAHLIAIRQLSR